MLKNILLIIKFRRMWTKLDKFSHCSII